MKAKTIAVINWVNQNSRIHLQLCSSSRTIYSTILQVLLPLSSKYIHNVVISIISTVPILFQGLIHSCLNYCNEL